jgi:DNA-binding NtrC family response regulator
MDSKVLVVSSDSEALATILDVLSGAGYQASGASTFSEGKRLLSEASPDLLIADERLEAFNGLHLILRGRYFDSDLDAVVMTPSEDLGLEAEAKRLNVPCVVRPDDPREWLRMIPEALGFRDRVDSMDDAEASTAA